MSNSSQKALELPEILDAIARSIPVYDPPTAFFNFSSEDPRIFTPHNLLPCTLVSRLWHACFIPYLYHHLFDDSQSSILRKRLAPFRKHSHHFRYYHSFSARKVYELPFEISLPPRNLVSLSLHRPSDALLDLLIWNQGSQLRELSCSGDWTTILFKSLHQEALMNLPCLQELVLVRWTLSSDFMYGMLSTCKSSLKRLRIESVSGLYEDLFFDHEKNYSGPDDHISSAIASKIRAPRFQMTQLTSLALALDWVQSTSSIFFPCVCPALERLDLTVDTESFDFLQLSRNLRLYCPNFHTLRYKEGYSMEYEHGCFPVPDIYAGLFKNCSLNGLKYASLGLPMGLNDLMLDALLTHAATLETLKLRNKYWNNNGRAFSSLEMSQVLHLLTNCRNLKHLVLNGTNCSVRTLEDLCTQPWVCTKLEYLVIDGYIDSPPLQELSRSDLRPHQALKEVQQRVRRQAAQFPEVDHEKYKDDGQGWYMRCDMDPLGFLKAKEDEDIKRRLFVHMAEISGVKGVKYLRLRRTEFFAEPPSLAGPEDDVIGRAFEEFDLDKE
ncbi:hypothetical protein BC939DRAFT_447274 [Gamsiella multidivaricata]|uniref:uncharacterized protein n=1 Tax=Gamsiella multidivaricata TaxID=101098 RepID=UPI002220C7A2|nr:uncharacterized protein BC939DRAFT_447274 [Gamsiella multidivaricata]KAG0364309.1 hypothetical protein BGZ54_007660 [Gamsiella multidivaricata]KAI7826209.1 hypothetical protein BC939DRAFT_447274 [Gamsiella multidivaricata]